MTKKLEIDVNEWQEKLDILRAEFSLHEFLKQAWPIIEGKTPFIDSWHLQAIAEHLEAAYNREIRNLLINVPPRSGKTTLISVCWPVWCHIHDPSLKFIFASYAKSLSLEHAVKCRRLIESNWFQKNWGNIFKLTSDQNTKSYFENDKKGYRLSTSIGAAVTGSGGNFLVCFPYNTIIKTSLGDLAIGEIVEYKKNCEILTYNHFKEQLEYKTIETYFKSFTNEVLQIELENGEILECTENHPIYINKKGYVLAKDLQVEDVIFFLN